MGLVRRDITVLEVVQTKLHLNVPLVLIVPWEVGTINIVPLACTQTTTVHQRVTCVLKDIFAFRIELCEVCKETVAEIYCSDTCFCVNFKPVVNFT